MCREGGFEKKPEKQRDLPISSLFYIRNTRASSRLGREHSKSVKISTIKSN